MPANTVQSLMVAYSILILLSSIAALGVVFMKGKSIQAKKLDE